MHNYKHKRAPLGDKMDLEMIERLTLLARRLRVPRSALTRKLVGFALDHCFEGELIMANDEWTVWPAAERVLSFGKTGRPSKISSGLGGSRLGSIEFR